MEKSALTIALPLGIDARSKKRQKKAIFFLIISLNILTVNSAWAQDFPIHSSEDIFHPVIAKNGMVASQEDLATQAGLQVLKEGGNAIDAAVTIGFTPCRQFRRGRIYVGTFRKG
jgi:hypothetical protein